MIDLKALAKTLGGDLVDSLEGFVTTEAGGDLRVWGEAIMLDGLRAVQENKPELLAELREQVKAVGEVERIRLVGFTWDQVTKWVFTLAKVALALAL